jgi:predicted RNA binding protein YcfA (HicA-like mRNA interferase family)
MPPFSAIKWKDFVRYLKLAGFQGPYPGGKHQYMIKDQVRLTIPNPHQDDISKNLLSRLLSQANISRDEWEKL